MKNNISDNNWDNLGSKVSEYTPDEFIASDWDTMESMLNPPVAPAASLTILLKKNAPLFVSIVALSMATFVMVTSLSDKEISINNSTAATVIEVETARQNDNVTKSTVATDVSVLTNALQNEIATQESTTSVSEQPAKTETIANEETTGKNVSSSSNQTINNSKSANTSKVIESKTNNNTPANNKIYFNQIPIQKSKNLISDTTSIENDESNLIFAQSRFYNTNTENLLLNSVERNTLVGEPIPSLGIAAIDSPEFEFSAPPANKVVTNPIDKRIKFGVQFGLNNSITDYSSLRTSHLPFGGIYIKKRLSEKWEIQLGAQMKFVNNYELNRNTRVEWFTQNGRLHGFSEVEFRSTGYRSFDFPLTLNYKVNNIIQIVSGLRYSYIPSTSKYNSISNTAFGVGEPINSPFDSDSYFAHWNHDLGIVLGAKYNINRKWSADLRWNQGLRDITPDDLFGDDKTTHLNSDLQLSLTYTF